MREIGGKLDRNRVRETERGRREECVKERERERQRERERERKAHFGST